MNRMVDRLAYEARASFEAGCDQCTHEVRAKRHLKAQKPKKKAPHFVEHVEVLGGWSDWR